MGNVLGIHEVAVLEFTVLPLNEKLARGDICGFGKHMVVVGSNILLLEIPKRGQPCVVVLLEHGV